MSPRLFDLDDIVDTALDGIENVVSNPNKRKKGKVFMAIIVIAIITLIAGSMCVERIPTGYVGVVYSMNGGVQDEVLYQGWHFVSPTKKITKYSVATEQLYMSQEDTELSPGDESFNVICKDGKMNIDFEMSYSFNPDDVTTVFQKYRGMAGEDVVNNIAKGKIRTKISEVTSNYTVLDAYMERKAELNKDIENHLREYLKEFGISVESANITNARVDPQVEKTITERSTVAQQLEVEKQKQEKAKLEAQTKIIAAEGEAKKKIIEAEAEAERNRVISASLTPELLEKMEMEARLKHGWVSIQGATTVVTEKE